MNVSLKPHTFESRPFTVAAMQFDGTPESIKAIQKWTEDGGAEFDNFNLYNQVRQECELWVAASAAWCRVHKGDWVVRERDNTGYYPVAAKVFASRYSMKDSLK